MNTVIYHNTQCSKSRATLALLNEHGIEPTLIHYLETPPTKEDLVRIVALLGKTPKEIIRFNETAAIQQNLSSEDHRTDDEWLEIMVNNPVLIERPIVIIENKAALGRPPENILSILPGAS
ncbi:MAG: arsenate reductase (glutaredoxin) [Candidatus Competibacteraceae bacterium]|nr:arsenate reductase (glutaredoxin) [Candidatus Competibacteraceae bacterium]